MLGLKKEVNSWKNATIMAKASMYAYKDLNSFKKEFHPEAVLFDRDGTQVYCWIDNNIACVAFRGTEPNEWSDIKADLKIRKVKVPTGFVHRGFKDALDEVWEDVLKWIKEQKRESVFFTGHSLGGALATLAASRWNTIETHLYTYGSPRVGGRKFVKSFLSSNGYRFRNNNDIVTKVPFWIMGFRHHGTEWYINHYGNFRSKSFWQRLKDSWRGRWKALTKRKFFDGMYDHSITEYSEKLKKLI